MAGFGGGGAGDERGGVEIPKEDLEGLGGGEGGGGGGTGGCGGIGDKEPEAGAEGVGRGFGCEEEVWAWGEVFDAMKGGGCR